MKMARDDYVKAEYFDLDPLFSAHVKLFLKEMLQLEEYPEQAGVYSILNHPVQKVHVMGDVTLVDHRRHFTLYSIDDATGTVQCLRWYNSEPVPKVRLGQLVSVYGKVLDYQGNRQIRVYQIFPERDPSAEILHMAAILRLKSTVYATPFVLPAHLVRYQEGEKSEEMENEEQIAEVMKKWLLEKTPVHFSIDSIYEDEKLLSDIKCICGESELKVKVQSALQLLVKLDILAVVNLQNQDVVFKYIDYVRELKPAVLSFISAQGESSMKGVHVEKIVKALPQFTRRRLLQSLQLLQQSSDIFECDTDSFKAT